MLIYMSADDRNKSEHKAGHGYFVLLMKLQVLVII